MVDARSRGSTSRDAAPPSEVEAFDRADQALRALAALSGLMHENMNRVAGWRFLDMGRRIERGINTCRFARHLRRRPTPRPTISTCVLDLVDSADHLSLALPRRRRARRRRATWCVLDPYQSALGGLPGRRRSMPISRICPILRE